VLSGRDLCDELITRPEESYRLWCVIVCDLETFVNEEALAHWVLQRQKQTNQQNNQPTEQIVKRNHIDQQANISINDIMKQTHVRHAYSLRMPCYELQPSADWYSDSKAKKYCRVHF